MKKTIGLITLSLAVGFTAGVFAKGAVKSTRTPASTLTWTKPMGDTGPEMSVVYGDPNKGPAGMFLKFQPGFESGWHTHDASYTAIVVQGNATHLLQGEKENPAMPSGSWFSQAAKENHFDSCGKDGPCVVFVHSDGKFTFHPKTAEGKDPPKEAAPAKK